MTETARKPSGARPLRGVALWQTKIGATMPRGTFDTTFDQLSRSIPLAELFAMFAAKGAAYETVRCWRRGSRQAPAWAIDMLINRLENDARKLLELAAMGERAKKEGR